MNPSRTAPRYLSDRDGATRCSTKVLGAPGRGSVPRRWRRERTHSSPQSQEARPYIRRPQSSVPPATVTPLLLLAIVLGVLIAPVSAALVNFENCLSPNIINSNPVQLQFIPLHLDAKFNITSPSHNLNVTVYGNVSGVATQVPYPAPDDPQWSNPNSIVGKIVDLSQPNNKYSTLFAKFNVLSYTPYDATPSRFCNSTIYGTCPLGPAFTANAYVLGFVIVDLEFIAALVILTYCYVGVIHPNSRLFQWLMTSILLTRSPQYPPPFE